jgi:hypothetical protein
MEKMDRRRLFCPLRFRAGRIDGATAEIGGARPLCGCLDLIGAQERGIGA